MNYTNKELKNFLEKFFLEPIAESEANLKKDYEQDELLKLERDAESMGFEPIKLSSKIRDQLIHSKINDSIESQLRVIQGEGNSVTLTEILKNAINISKQSIKDFSKAIGVKEKFIANLITADDVTNIKKKCKLMAKLENLDNIVNLLSFLGLNIRDWIAYRSIYLRRLDDSSIDDLTVYGLELEQSSPSIIDVEQDEQMQRIIDSINDLKRYDLL